MPKPPIKIQVDLERHIRVYVDMLNDKGYDVDACVLEEAIVIMQRHYYAVLPTQNRFKRAVYHALYKSPEGVLSVDEMMEAAASARLISDRRRLNIVLSKGKRVGELSNPARGHWALEQKGIEYVEEKEELLG